MSYDNTDGANEVDTCHGRNNHFGYVCDRFNTANGDNCNQDGKCQTSVASRNASCDIGNFYDGVNLCEGTYAQARTADTKDSKQDCQEFIVAAQAHFDVVHRATGDVAVFVNFTEFYCQHTFCVFSSHTEECCEPHPEQCTRTTCFKSSSNTYDVTGTNGCCKSSTKSFKAVNVAFAFAFSGEDKFQCHR